ncbi:MAG: glycosyltransferase family 4 protein [Ideonella sp.]
MSLPAPVFSNHGLRRAGGIEAYLATLIHGLHRRGIRPTVVAKRFDHTMAEAGWVDAVQPWMFGVPVKLRDRWFDWQLRRLKTRHHWFPLIALNQTAAADIAVCGSNHPAHLVAMQQSKPRSSDRWKIDLERQHLERSRVIIAHSRLLSRQVQQHYGIAPGKIVVAYPPVDGERFSPVTAQVRAQLRQQLDLPDDRPVFLLVSTGHARKGLDIAIAAVARASRPCLLVMAGRPPDIDAPNLRFLGYRSDIENVYRAVDATLLPSRYEPFGLVGVESVLCGTPVLIERGAGCAEVLLPPAALPFDLGDAGSLDAAVELALDRWQRDALRIAEPRAALAYDPSVQAHLDVLLDWVERLRAERDQAAG